MSLSSEEVISRFKALCDKHNRLFIPDPPREDAVAESLGKYYSEQDLVFAMEKFIKSDPGPHLIFDFALRSRDIVEKNSYDKKSEEHFKQVVAQTRKKFENEL